jgi:hypothetical protein
MKKSRCWPSVRQNLSTETQAKVLTKIYCDIKPTESLTISVVGYEEFPFAGLILVQIHIFDLQNKFLQTSNTKAHIINSLLVPLLVQTLEITKAEQGRSSK